MSTVQLPGTIRFDSQMQMQTGTKNVYVSLAKESQQHLKNKHRKDDIILNNLFPFKK